MARVYQEAHMLQNLTEGVKNLQTQVADLARSRGYQDEKIKNLTTANEALIKQNALMEIRMKSNEHNASARIGNLCAFLSAANSSNNVNPAHIPLTPLWDVGTGRPMRNFPKHERDIRTMGQAEVIQCLQALGIKTLGMGGAAERKARLRKEVGLLPE